MTTFAVRCDNPDCPHELPGHPYRQATMPDVGPELHARPPIHCTCGYQVRVVYEVDGG